MPNSSTQKFAVVTGASSGIGLELARQFAQHGYSLLIASSTPRIREAENDLRREGANVESLQVDLATEEGNQELYRAIQESGHRLDAIAINAGVGISGDFARETRLEDELNLIRLNVISPVHLTKLIAKEMIQNGGGKILYTSSIAGDMPGPYEAVYNASKAFLTSFGQAVRNELRDTKVTVTLLMPGATETDFFHRAGLEDTKIGASEKDDPAEVARQGFEAMMDGKDHVVAGSFMNKVQSVAGDVLPDTAVAGMHRKQSEPGSAKR